MNDAKTPKQSEWPEFYNVAHPNDDHWVTMYVRGDIRDAQVAASQAQVEAVTTLLKDALNDELPLYIREKIKALLAASEPPGEERT
jgi:hypothetical protein